MKIPDNIIKTGKAALQSLWDDRVTVRRGKTIGNVKEDAVVYNSVLCHFSQTSRPALEQGEEAATNLTVAELFVDTDVILNAGDALEITHKGQKITGVAGKPFHGSFSNSVRVEELNFS